MIAKQEAATEHPAQAAQSLFSVRLTDRGAWFGAMVAAIFNALGMFIEIAIDRKIPGIPTRPAEVSAFLALILCAILFVRRKTLSVKWAYVAYLFTTASVVTTLLMTNMRFALLEKHWVPFQESKLGCLAAAMVAPGFWVGLLSIVAYCLSALLQFEFFFSPQVKASAGAAEPWPTLAFGLCGVLALVYRFRRAQMEQEVSRIQAQNISIKQLAHISLDIRDRMNTPLQVIEFSEYLLRHSNHPVEPILDHIDRSVKSLREINSVLVQYEKEIELETSRDGIAFKKINLK